MKRTRFVSRKGMSLAEMLVGLVILGIVATLFTRLLVAQGKFFDKQAQGTAARNVSRGALNRAISDLRMVEAGGGVLAASATSVTIRVPYAMGVVCATAGGVTTATLLPVDSVMYAQPGFYGYAWRSSTSGLYNYVEAGASVANGTASVCTNAAITTLTNGKVIALTPALPAAATFGTPVLLFRRVRYEFKASNLVTGKTGLWRTVINPNGSETAEELVAPFASTASFKFFAVNNQVAQTNPPASLADLRGFELHLDGMSERVVSGKTAAESAPFITAVYFKNRMT
jgi:prepilin-type N-terminal cleavage/methylation domain-containing protein